MPSEPDPSFPKEVAIDAGGARAEAVPITPTTTSSDSDSDTISDASSHYDPINTGEKETHRPIQRTISRASHGSGIGEYADITDGLRRQKTSASVATTGTTDPAFEIDFEEDDKKNPQAWPLWFKGCIIATMSYGTTTVVMYSTSYTAAIPGLQKSFGISDSVGISGVTTYLMGMAVGSVISAPLSEMYGRRPIYIIASGIFVILSLPCALAPNIEAISVTRFFGAFAASAMISNAPGTVNDIVDETHRALAFSIWSIGPMNGPVIGPVVGGFVFQYLGWRWTNWVVMIVAGVAFVIVSSIPETYAPAILRKRAARKRQETGDDRWWSRYDEKAEFLPLLKVNLSRPFVMTVTEPICIFWDVYIAIVYGILYLCFVAYPIIFSDIRGWSPGITGLAYCGIGIGCSIIIVSEPLIRRMIDSHAPDPETGKPPPEAMVSILCIASVIMPIGQIWFSWTCTPNYHWIVPISAGIPFGAGNAGIFIYASNYLVHSYGIYAASALAGNAVSRSMLGATLPLAGPSMYAKLGPHWAGTLCGLLEVACIPIPFIFYKYGHRIRMKSGSIRRMQEDKMRLERKKRKAQERSEHAAENRAEADAETGAGMETGAAIGEEVDSEKAVRRESR